MKKLLKTLLAKILRRILNAPWLFYSNLWVTMTDQFNFFLPQSVQLSIRIIV